MEEMNYFEDIENEETTMEMDPVEVDTEESGIGAGMVALICAGGAAAFAAAVHFGKKMWAKHKTKKELRMPDEENIVEVTDEDIEKVTTPKDANK